DFAYATTGSGPAGWSGFSLDDDSDGTLPNTRTFTFDSSQLGAKTVTETLPVAGWTPTGLLCSKGTTNTATGLASFTLAAGDAVTCAYQNTKDATLTVVKSTDPANSGASTFPFTTASAGMSNFTLDTNGADGTNPSSKTF